MESASHATGSPLIWDTGEYSILPRHKEAAETHDELSESASSASKTHQGSHLENKKLIEASQRHYIRLRLHGVRLPSNYSITIRLPSANDTHSQILVTSQNRRRKTSSASRKQRVQPTDSGSDSHTDLELDIAFAVTDASENEAPDSEVALIRATNAYTGATKSIGSVHQRRRSITLGRQISGFVRLKHGQDKRRWVRKVRQGFEPFFVPGADVGRSVVTKRLAGEVESDEGVGFVGRANWKPVIE